MSKKASDIDKKIKEGLEKIYIDNKKWMSRDRYEWFINYKLVREDIGDVAFDTSFLVDALGNMARKSILDVGCGTGDLVVSLARKIEDVEIVGIDMSADDIEIAKLKALKYNLPLDIFHVQNGASLPFDNNSFDILTCIEVLEHTGKHYMDVVNEIYRVQKPGGVAYITIPNKHCPYDTHLYTWIPHWLPKRIRVFYLDRVRGEKAKSENYLLDYNFFSSREIAKILKPFSNTLDVNKKYLNYLLNKIKLNSSDRWPKKVLKKTIQTINGCRPLKKLMINILSCMYCRV
jgi:ubiquinone/menaquinone biosynthesis C-methylase UbiE